jgi:hypothetical protein
MTPEKTSDPQDLAEVARELFALQERLGFRRVLSPTDAARLRQLETIMEAAFPFGTFS